MSALRPLRGGCQCGRNRYIIAVPQDGVSEAQVLFNTEPHHREYDLDWEFLEVLHSFSKGLGSSLDCIAICRRSADSKLEIPLATPLAAYIRVPLSWYHSTTYAFFPDETHSMIRRVYTHPSQEYSKRHFCGFCGTPLSYWSENPHSEAEYINLTLGSLLREDLRDLEDMGLIPDEAESEDKEEEAPSSRETVLRQSYGVPWFDGMVEGTRIGSMRRSQGIRQSQDGRVRVEWEIVEYSGNGSDLSKDQSTESRDDDVEMELTHHGKRKLQDRDDADVATKDD